MVAPNPQERISPSGPLAGNSGGGSLAPPMDQMGGNYYLATANGINSPYVASSIGPVGGPADKVTNCYFFSGATDPDPSKVNNLMTGDASNLPAYSAGVWMFDAALELGFTTSLPALTSCGVLSLRGYLTNSAKSILSVQTNLLLSSVPRGNVDGAGSAFPSMRNVRLRSPIVLSQADIDSNGPITDVMMRLSRTTADGSNGDYDASSGYLQFGSNTTVRVYRIR